MILLLMTEILIFIRLLQNDVPSYVTQIGLLYLFYGFINGILINRSKMGRLS